MTHIPKVELHRHLELCLRPETLRDLAGDLAKDRKALEENFLITHPMDDLASVLNRFLNTQKLLSTPQILKRITYEAVADAAREGVRILELRYAPTFIREGHENMSFDDIHQSVCEGVQEAEREFPITVGLICTLQRTLPVAQAKNVVDFVITHKESFVGIDLADNEKGWDSKPFAPHFLRAKSHGLGITVHSGEENLPKAPRYVRDAIEHLGAERIGHGLQIYRSPEMMESVRERGICP